MAAYRFYRLDVTKVSSSTTYFDAIRLFDGGGTNRATAGNCTISSNATGNVTNAIDENPDTFWGALGGSAPGYVGWYIAFDFGAGKSWDITQIGITNSTYTEVLKGANIFASNDGTTWQSWGWFSDRTAVARATSLHNFNPAPAGIAAVVSPPSAVSAFGGGRAQFALPRAALGVFGGGSGEISFAPATLDMLGGACAALSASGPVCQAQGHDSTGERAAHLSAPASTLIAFGGASAAMISASLSFTGSATVTNWGGSELFAPPTTVSASGTVADTGHAAVSCVYDLIGYGGAICSITLTGGATVIASGAAGGIGAASMRLPLFALAASGSQDETGRATLIGPALRMASSGIAHLVAPGYKLTAIGHAVVAITYEAYAVNLLSGIDRNPQNQYDADVDEVTHYTNYPFTQIVRYDGSYYGVAADGLYLLEGDTDAGAPIAWSFRTVLTDGGNKQKKRVRSVYVGARLIDSVVITLVVGEAQDLAYNYTTPRSSGAQNYRQLFGKGVSARYFALEMSDPLGNFIEVDSIDLENEILERAL